MPPAPIAIDGGWGWIVVLGAFVAYFIADGWSYSFGVIHKSFLGIFQQSNGRTSVVGALLYGFPLLISPVVCALVTSFGSRKMGILGGFIFGSSLIVSVFSTSVEVMYITIGVMSSIGLSMAYISSLVIVTYYFERRRGFATGLAVTGSGLGAFALPPLLKALIDAYTIRGTLLIVGGIGFNIIVAGALFRAPPMMKNEVQEDLETCETELHADEDLDGDVEDMPPTTGRSKRAERPMSLSQESSDGSTGGKQLLKKQSHSLDDSQLSRGCLGGSEVARRACGTNDEHEARRLLGEVEKGLPSSVSSRKSSSSPDIFTESTARGVDVRPAAGATPRPSQPMVFWLELRTAILSMMDPSFIFNTPYLLFCVSNLLLYLWVGVPYLFLVNYAVEHNINDEDTPLLLSIIGITRTIGQLVLGYLGDNKRISTAGLYAVCIMICGMMTMLLPLFQTYPSLCTFSAVFGFTVSVTYSLQMMVVVDIVGITKATYAFGLVQLSQGISTLLGTPVAGWLRDATGQYEETFYIGGASILVSGLIILPLPCFIRQWKRTHDPDRTTDTA